MSARFEQWTRAKLGEYVERDGETWVTVTVPVDSVRHDPRADVIAALTPGVVHFKTAIEGPLLDGPAAPVPTVSAPMVVTEVDRERGFITVDGDPKTEIVDAPTAPKRRKRK